MKQKRVYKTYTQEFKKEAVALVTDQGYSVAEAARSLGLNANLLYKWKEQQEAQASGAVLSLDEREELKTLRSENKRLRMEKDILKKASVDSTDQCNTYVKTSVHRDLLSETYETQKTVIYTAGKSIYF